MKILFGQIIFVRKYYTVIYTWYDHWAEVLGKEMNYTRGSSWLNEHFEKHREKNLIPNKSQMMPKKIAGPNFHASLMQLTCYKMQGVTLGENEINDT